MNRQAGFTPQAIKDTLYTAVLCDVLDSLGFRHQAMHRRLRPLLQTPNQCGFVGRAKTFRWMEVDYVDEQNPYGLEIEAMDSLRPGDVVVYSTDYAASSAPWGELMTRVAMRNGTVGCICDGNVRDSLKIIEMGFPVFCTGVYPVDSKGRGMVEAFDVPLRCADVAVRPGDLVFADYDGIVVVPQDVEQETLRLATEKANREKGMGRALMQGRTLRQAYDEYGIL